MFDFQLHFCVAVLVAPDFKVSSGRRSEARHRCSRPLEPLSIDTATLRGESVPVVDQAGDVFSPERL